MAQLPQGAQNFTTPLQYKTLFFCDWFCFSCFFSLKSGRLHFILIRASSLFIILLALPVPVYSRSSDQPLLVGALTVPLQLNFLVVVAFCFASYYLSQQFCCCTLVAWEELQPLVWNYSQTRKNTFLLLLSQLK